MDLLMDAPELIEEPLDLYETRTGLSNREHDELDLTEGWELLPSGNA